AHATKYLHDLVDTSGGQLYQAPSITDLDAVFLKIAAELGRQYTLWYYPTNASRDSLYRRIQVLVDRPAGIVRSRSGYRPLHD
ncbi:MAG: hypothetical protein ABIL01_06705, partial [Pseudomonadota bacterium]